MENLKEARETHANALNIQGDDQEKWEYDNSSGYYYNQSNGFYYDPNSGFYYSDFIGKWVTKEEAYATLQFSSNSGQKNTILKTTLSNLAPVLATENKSAARVQSGSAPGPVVSAALNPTRSVKGFTSSLAVGKRKRPDEKPKVIPAEEVTALKAREAARKRVEEREKSFLGLYKH